MLTQPGCLGNRADVYAANTGAPPWAVGSSEWGHDGVRHLLSENTFFLFLVSVSTVLGGGSHLRTPGEFKAGERQKVST